MFSSTNANNINMQRKQNTLSLEKKQLIVAYKLSHKSLESKLHWIQKQINVKLVPVNEIPFDKKEHPILRITKKKIFLELDNQTLFFHPSMALLRMINIRKGIPDRFLQAADLTKGDIIIDATMGLASDALIAAWAVGNEGRVLAIEYSPLIYLLVKEGLERLRNEGPPEISNKEKKHAWQDLIQASSRIKIHCTSHERMFVNLPHKSVDVVYFDPMFRTSVDKSSSMKPVKMFSYTEPIKEETIARACKIAKKRVVLKERKEGREFERLGFKRLEGGLYSQISYGLILLEDKNRGDRSCSPLL